MFSAVSNQWDQQFSTACLSLKLMLVTSLFVVLNDKNCWAAPIDPTQTCTSSRLAEHDHQGASVASLDERFATPGSMVSSMALIFASSLWAFCETDTAPGYHKILLYGGPVCITFSLVIK